MPELPEVETVRRALATVWAGRRFAHVTVRRSDLRRPLPANFVARLCGRRTESVERRGKVLVVTLDDDLTLLAHLGMSGRMMISATPPAVPGPHEHVMFETDDGIAVTYADPRRFGLLDLASTAHRDEHPLLKGLGPEPLDPTFNGDVLVNMLAGRRMSVKVALLDQRMLAGLGNIYACEALFRAEIPPDQQARSIRRDQAQRLAESIRAVLEAAIAAGGSTLRDHVQPSGEPGSFQHSLAVYGREGSPCEGCSCGGNEVVRRIVQSGRATFFCAHKQRS